MSIETKKTELKWDPKVYSAILDLKQELKKRAQEQKEVRLAKMQKCPLDRARITGLHRLYLRLRGKSEEHHNLPDVDYRKTAALKEILEFLEKHELSEE